MGSEPISAAQPLSKRQRRLQGSHPSTKWQQQPRIKSASARAKAYINYAGLSDKENKKSSSLDPTLDLNSPEVKFGRMLGSTDQRKRHEAVKMLQMYLRARSDYSGEGISELDLMKLWKGLWYTMYMCDKVPVQDRLSEILAETMWCLGGSEESDEYAGQVYLQMNGDEGSEEDCDEIEGVKEEDHEMIDQDIEKYMDEEMDSDDDDYKILSVEEVEDEEEDDDEHPSDAEEDAPEDEKHCRGAHLVSMYIATFLRTVRREWGNVDKHRVDKFYTAVRMMLSETYKYMAKRYWNMGIVRLFNDVLYEEALSRTPNGLRYHLIDICVQELAKVNKEASVPLTEATFLDCLEPFFAMVQRVDDKNVQKRVAESVMFKFLNEYSFVSDDAICEDESSCKPLIFSQVHVGTVAKFIFEIASDGDTDVRYRKALYEMHKTFVRKIRAAGRDVDTEAGRYPEEEECGACGACDNCNDTPIDNVAGQEIPNATMVSKTGKKKTKNHNTDSNKKSSETINDTPDLKEDHSVLSMKSSKKKKRNNEDVDSTAAVLTTPSTKSNEIHDSTPSTKSKKKKRSKEDISKTSIDAVEKDTQNSAVDETPPPHAVSKKKKKKQHTAKYAESSEGEVITNKIISSPNSFDGEGQESNLMSASKRVSFGAHNQSKSHKASMKALKTLKPDVWSTANRTPDRSILLKRPQTDVKKMKSKKKKRKST